MNVYRLRFMLSVICLSAVSGAALAAAPASNAATPDVACLQTPAKMEDSDLKSFMTNPRTLLTANPAGGLPLSNQVRELAGSSSLAFGKIMDLAKTANEGQRSAIAAGLARVVYVCGTVGTDTAQDYAAAIQASVASFGDPAFASTFQQSSKDINVASVGPGAGSPAIGGGETSTDQTQQGATNNYKSPGDAPMDTSTGQYTIGSAGDTISPNR